MTTRRNFIKNTGAISLASVVPNTMFSVLVSADNSWKSDFESAMAQNPFLRPLQGINDPNVSLQQSELRLEGTLPSALRGTFYRNGPTQHEIGDMRYHHFFDGDGMIKAFHFDGDKVSHQSKFVATEKFMLEKQAGKHIERGFGTFLPSMRNAKSADAINTANINIIKYDGELLALWEGGSAYQIDEKNLDTIGIKHWSRQTAGLPFAAHPRIDTNNTLWSFGYAPLNDALVIYHIEPRNGENKRGLKNVGLIPVPNTPMVHDFMVTDNYLVFILPPYNFDKELKGSFLDHYVWDASKNGEILIVDKNNFQQVKRYDIPAFWVFHFSNAYEDSNGNIRFQAPIYQSPNVMTDAFVGIMRGDQNVPFDHPKLADMTVNINNGKFDMQYYSETVNSEFPRINENFIGKQHRYMISLQNTPQKDRMELAFNTLLRVDTQNQQTEKYIYGDWEMAEEHIFVPNPEKSGEGDGWILGTTIDVKQQHTILNVFDAENISDGPVARLHLDYMLPFGLHGNFVAA